LAGTRTKERDRRKGNGQRGEGRITSDKRGMRGTWFGAPGRKKGERERTERGEGQVAAIQQELVEILRGRRKGKDREGRETYDKRGKRGNLAWGTRTKESVKGKGKDGEGRGTGISNGTGDRSFAYGF
jgi:hypothetical protein